MKRNNGVHTHMESRKTSMPDCGLYPRVTKSDYRAVENTPEQKLLAKISALQAFSESASVEESCEVYPKLYQARRELEELRKEMKR